jgi:hypothetical protein
VTGQAKKFVLHLLHFLFLLLLSGYPETGQSMISEKVTEMRKMRQLPEV